MAEESVGQNYVLGLKGMEEAVNEAADQRNMRMVIFLTSAIDVNDTVMSVVNSANERAEEYRSALKAWGAAAGDSKIVFCDNSGFDLSIFKDDLARMGLEGKVEFLSFSGQGFPRSLGKGYGEMLTFRYAAEHSSFFDEADLILKVNGRYFLNNIDAILTGIAESDARIVGNWRHNLTWFDSRVFAFDKEFLTAFLLKELEAVDDSKGIYFEHALAKAVHLAMGCGYPWTMLPTVPVIKGRSGSTGRKYSTSGLRLIGKSVYQFLMRRLIKL